jgi:hypothetical protein
MIYLDSVLWCSYAFLLLSHYVWTIRSWEVYRRTSHLSRRPFWNAKMSSNAKRTLPFKMFEFCHFVNVGIVYWTFFPVFLIRCINTCTACPGFGDFVDRIYPIELEIKDTTDTERFATYLDLHLEIDSEERVRTKLYDKRDDFNFLIVNFPFICSNMKPIMVKQVMVAIVQLWKWWLQLNH